MVHPLTKINRLLRSKWLSVFTNLLTFTSFVFLIVYLYKFDYLSLEDIKIEWALLVISSLVLLLPVCGGVFAWKLALREYDIPISIISAIRSHGKSILAKYIPAPLIGVVGRAAMVSQEGHSLVSTSFVSLKLQVINLAIALMLGMIPLFIMDVMASYRWFFAVVYIALIFLLFSERVQGFALETFSKLTNQIIVVNANARHGMWPVKFVTVCQYFIYSISFLILVKCIYPEVNIIAAFAFPLSIAFGLIMFFIPGSIGIREGIMAWFLNLSGVPLPIAVTVAIIARLWFLFGEIFLFTMG